MRRKDYLIQFALAVGLFSIVSLFIRVPGYMDTEYYTLSARQIATGRGLTEPIIWNFLDDPTGLPHPSHTYWMPAPALLGSGGMILAGETNFTSARLLFILVAALSVPAASWFGFRFSSRRDAAWLAAGLAGFCGFYLPYTATVDSFYLTMVGGWVFFWLVDKLFQSGDKLTPKYWAGLGLAAGWMHLNRADGLIWLVATVGIWVWFQTQHYKLQSPSRLILSLFSILVGYLFITGFWYCRNLTLFSSLLPPGTSRAFWMTNYNELFTFPADVLTTNHWLSYGFSNIIRDRLQSFMHNLTVLAAVQGLVFLVPLWVIGIIKKRKDVLVHLLLVMEVVFLAIMSFAFPYSGARGGFLHSTAALQPVLWGLAAAGAADAVQKAAIQRKWNLQQALKVLFSGLVVISAAVSAFVFNLVVIGEDASHPVWEDSNRSAQVAAKLVGSQTDNLFPLIFINNPAGYALETNSSAIVIPDGDEASLMLAAEKYQIDYLVLEKNHVSGLNKLYENPSRNPNISLQDKTDETLLFKISHPEGEER